MLVEERLLPPSREVPVEERLLPPTREVPVEERLLPSSLKFSPPPAVMPRPLGEDHPERGRDSKQRVVWSSAEVDYIAIWCTRDQELNPGKGTIVARCRKAILLDPAARRVFHPNHVIDSARLRTGYEKFLQRSKTSLVEKDVPVEDGLGEFGLGELDFDEIFDV